MYFFFWLLLPKAYRDSLFLLKIYLSIFRKRKRKLRKEEKSMKKVDPHTHAIASYAFLK